MQTSGQREAIQSRNSQTSEYFKALKTLTDALDTLREDYADWANAPACSLANNSYRKLVRAINVLKG